MLTEYAIVYQGGCGEITEKKSRFIAHVMPIASEEDALVFIERMKKKYWDARHNCFAYVLGERHELARFSDDGEPAGTAGKPMLDVLLGEDIHDVAVVVTRYFGGTLLGTGGLVRAYSAAVKEGLSASKIIQKKKGFRLMLATEYGDLGKIQYILGERNICIIESSYTERVELACVVPVEEWEALCEALTEGSGGRVSMEKGERCQFGYVDGQVEFLD